MRCPESQERWLKARYDGVALPPPVAAHVSSCGACQAFVAAQQELDALLASETEEPVGPGFDTRFFARLAAAKAGASRQTSRRWAWSAGLALAACGLVCVALWWARPAVDAADLAVAADMEILQADVDMLARLEEVEAFQILAAQPPGTPP